jgi:hypothetical protein
MNKDLKNRFFDIPQNVLDQINSSLQNLNGQHVHGVNRAKKLLNDKKVKYGQLKRIIHDIKNLDKKKDIVKYNLFGGMRMEEWAKQYLQGERDLISDKKDSRKRADDIGSITGERKNSHLSKHKKSFSFKIPTNLIKSNSHKSSISPIKFSGLFEQIDRIKKLM